MTTHDLAAFAATILAWVHHPVGPIRTLTGMFT